jgi:hypothetical protein
MDNDIQRCAPPDEILRAIFGKSPAPAQDDEPMPTTALDIPNPWIAKTAGDRRLDFVADDAEEVELQSSLAPIRRLFSPQVTGAAPKLSDLPILPAENELDDEERKMFSPVRKLFYPGTKNTASAEASHELSKREATTFRTRVDENGFRWAEAFSSSGELIDARIIFPDSE